MKQASLRDSEAVEVDQRKERLVTRARDHGEEVADLILEGRYVGPAAERVKVDDLVAALLQEYEINGRKSLYWVKIKVNKHVLPLLPREARAQGFDRRCAGVRCQAPG